MSTLIAQLPDVALLWRLSVIPLIGLEYDPTFTDNWAFRLCYDDSETPVVIPPDLYRFINVCGESLKVDSSPVGTSQ